MKKLLSIITLILLITLILTACGGGDGSEPPSGTDEPGGNVTPDAPGGDGSDIPDATGYIYRKGTSVRIVNTVGDGIDVSGVFRKLLTLTGKSPSFVEGSEAAAAHEIIFGDSTRTATSRAKREISLDELTENEEAICIYAHGESIAIYTTNDKELMELAIEHLIKEVLTTEDLKLNGSIWYHKIDLKAKELEYENERRAADIARIEEKFGKGVAAAMSEYMALFDDDLYKWFASLYDPETGALYYSRSARNTEGFLPDIESTTRGYGWLASVGLLEDYNNNLSEALPDDIKEKVVAWIQGLQSPVDGYFYHPQWAMGTYNSSRLGRDMDGAVSFLLKLGSRVLYDTPSGVKGSLGAPSGALTRHIGASGARLASRVALSASLPENLSSLEAFEDYLNSLNWETETYSSGHKIESLATQIKNAGPEYVKLVESFLNAKQEAVQESLRDAAEEELLKKKPSATAEEIASARKAAENGIWEPVVKYESVNGLMKIASAYNDLGLKVNYAKEAFNSAVYIVTLDKEDADGKTANQIVNVFNPWVMLDSLLGNINKYGSAQDSAELKKQIQSNAETLIRATMTKLRAFKKEDGSFGYSAVGVPAYNQGMLSAVAGSNEGDVNGCTIATTNVLGHLCSALGIPRPQMFYAHDFEVFLEIIESAKPIVKEPSKIPTAKDPYERFDSYALGEKFNTGNGISMGEGYVEAIKDTRRGATGNSLKYVTVKGSNATATINTVDLGIADPNALVLEWSMNFVESNASTTAVQLRFGSAYMLTIQTSDNGYSFGDSSSTDSTKAVTNQFNGTYSYGKWYTFRLVQFVGDRNTVETRFYVDGKLVATSNNFYGKTVDGNEEPTCLLNNVRFFALLSADFTVILDDVKVVNDKLER